MTSSSGGILEKTSVIAISREDGKFKAVEVRAHGGVFEVLWSKSEETGFTDWNRFAAACGLSLEEDQVRERGRKLVVGFDSSAIAFYRLGLPAVGEKETESMIRLQAESRLPLPAEQMELAWRSGPMRNGEVEVTMAAGRRQYLESFVQEVEDLRPTKIVLDCEGVVEVWRRFFSGDEQVTVVVNPEARSSHVCLAEQGLLINSVALDVGTEDFETGSATGEQTLVSERFVRDMRSILELFGYVEAAEIPIVLLSDNGAASERMVSALRSAGLDARTAVADPGKVKAGTEDGAANIYEYRVALGLGFSALEGRVDTLDLFEHVYIPAEKRKKKHWLYSPIAAGAIALGMLIILGIVAYTVDVVTPHVMEKKLKSAVSDEELGRLEEQRKLMKAIAAQRPNLLELLKDVNASGEGGVKLTEFHFKKTQPVRIKGEARNTDQIYKLRESLLEKKGIRDVRIEGAPKAAKGGKFLFNITFQYKSFTQKKSVVR
jgi:hypothetical protein